MTLLRWAIIDFIEKVQDWNINICQISDIHLAGISEKAFPIKLKWSTWQLYGCKNQALKTGFNYLGLVNSPYLTILFLVLLFYGLTLFHMYKSQFSSSFHLLALTRHLCWYQPWRKGCCKHVSMDRCPLTHAGSQQSIQKCLAEAQNALWIMSRSWPRVSPTLQKQHVGVQQTHCHGYSAMIGGVTFNGSSSGSNTAKSRPSSLTFSHLSFHHSTTASVVSWLIYQDSCCGIQQLQLWNVQKVREIPCSVNCHNIAQWQNSLKDQ